MKSMSQIIQDIESMEDMDTLFLQTATINLMNAAVAKHGDRRIWITDDTRAYNAVMEIIMNIQPMRAEYRKPDPVKPPSWNKRADPADGSAVDAAERQTTKMPPGQTEHVASLERDIEDALNNRAAE